MYFLPAGRNAIARYMLWSCVCLSVCHKPVFCRNGWTNWAGFRHRGFLRLVIHRVARVNSDTFNNKTILSDGALFHTLNSAIICLCFFSPRLVDSRKCCQLISTDDSRQFVTLSVHFVYNAMYVTHSFARFVCGSWDLLVRFCFKLVQKDSEMTGRTCAETDVKFWSLTQHFV